jgi:hypothetical protein
LVSSKFLKLIPQPVGVASLGQNEAPILNKTSVYDIFIAERKREVKQDDEGRKMMGNGRAAHNGRSIETALMPQHSDVSLRHPRELRNGVVLYGSVRSSDGTTSYTVKKERVGSHRFVYGCTCLGNFLGHYLCKHLAAFKLAEAQAAQRNGVAPEPHLAWE